MEVEVDKPSREFKTKQFWASVLGEFLATSLLVFIVTSVFSVNSSIESSDTDVQTALAYGLGVATLVHWTEGLLNPALAVAFTSTGKISFLKGVLFIIMEIVGGIAGAGLSYAVTPEESRSKITLGDTVLADNMSTIQGLFLEFILTFILTLAVYAAKDPGRKCEGYDMPLTYGFAVTVCQLVGCRYTTCSLNPSRSFGPAVIRELSDIGKPEIQWECHWIYWIGPIGGALLAGILYHFLFAKPNRDYDVFQPTRAGTHAENESETIL